MPVPAARQIKVADENTNRAVLHHCAVFQGWLEARKRLCETPRSRRR